MKAWNSTLNTGKGFKPRKPWNYERKKLRQVRPESVLTPNEAAKSRIQPLLRDFVILRDGGCLLRKVTAEAGNCGGYRKDGGLILQAEHLNSRRHAISFADTRLVICLCERHHIFFKKQEPDLYYKLVKRLIGPTRTALLDQVENDHRAHKADWIMEEMALKQELKALQNKVILL